MMHVALLATLATIPYFTLPPIDLGLGPLTIQPFGILVATGVLVGASLGRRYGERVNLDDEHLRKLIFTIVVGGFIGAHLFDVLVYTPDRLAEDPLLLIKIWAGISSYGGFIGGFVSFVFYVRKHNLAFLPYGDAILWGLAPGFTIGRIGCTIVHDHLGKMAPADFPLAIHLNLEQASKHGVQPGPHHDLGLYEFLYLLVVLAGMWLLKRTGRRPHGFVIAYLAIAYPPARFFFEYLRFTESDPRYLGFTFAQWMSVVVLICGLLTMVMIYRRTAATPELRGAPLPAAPAPSPTKPAASPARKSRKK